MFALESENRVEIRKNVWMHYKVKGSGNPMVCIHGWNDNSDSWKEQMEYFSSTHTVYVIDLLGHGKSSVSKELNSVTLQTITSEVLIFMDKMGLREIELLCHSIGCLIGLNIAAIQPKLIKNLNLINPISVATLKLLNTLKTKMLRGVPSHRCILFSYFTQKFGWKEFEISQIDTLMPVNVIRGAEDISEAKDYMPFLSSVFPLLNFIELGEKNQEGKIVKAKHAILLSHADEINTVIAARSQGKKMAA